MEESDAMKTLEPVLDEFVELILYLESLNPEDSRRMFATIAVKLKSQELEKVVPEILSERVREVIKAKKDVARRQKELEALQAAEIEAEARWKERNFFLCQTNPSEMFLLFGLPTQKANRLGFLTPVTAALLLSHAMLMSILIWLVVKRY